MTDPTDTSATEPVRTPDAGEIEWAGSIMKKPPHAEDGKGEQADPSPDPIDGAERVGDHHYPG